MRNLAGNNRCDEYIRDELMRARIDIVGHPAPGKDEVPASIMGKLGAFTFQRGWYYWIVSGELPIEVARELWADPEGRATVRAAGRAGGSDPDNHVQWFDADDNVVEVDPTGEQEKETRAFVARHPNIDMYDVRHVRSLDDIPDRSGVIDCYHIDDQAGLRLFADTLRKHGLAAEAPQ